MQPEQQQRIMGYFIEEAKDHLNTIEQGLLNLQQAVEDPEITNEMFRAAHSIKGGAAMLGLDSIQQVSHRLEDFFKILKDHPVKLDQKAETLFLQIFDALQDLTGQLQGPYGLVEEEVATTMAGVEPAFGQLEQHLQSLLSGSAPSVAAPALPQIFGSDVTNALRQMLDLFKRSESETGVRQQLLQICQTLVGYGSQFNLPTWTQLADATQRAIAHEPNRYRSLAPVVIKDLKQAQELVLSGRAAEIAISLQLEQLLPAPTTTASSLTLDEESLFGTEALTAEVNGSGQPGQADLAELNFDSLQLDANQLGSPAANLEGESLTPEPLDLGPLTEEPLFNDAPLRTGPEVGIAELNTLADLFDSDLPDLDATWIQEESRMDGSDLFDGTELSGGEELNDFSDLLFDEATPSSINTSDDDDLRDLFGDDFGAETTPPTVALGLESDEFSDFLTIGGDTDQAGEADLFGGPDFSSGYEPDLGLSDELSSTDSMEDLFGSDELDSFSAQLALGNETGSPEANSLGSLEDLSSSEDLSQLDLSSPLENLSSLDDLGDLDGLDGLGEFSGSLERSDTGNELGSFNLDSSNSLDFDELDFGELDFGELDLDPTGAESESPELSLSTASKENSEQSSLQDLGFDLSAQLGAETTTPLSADPWDSIASENSPANSSEALGLIQDDSSGMNDLFASISGDDEFNLEWEADTPELAATAESSSQNSAQNRFQDSLVDPTAAATAETEDELNLDMLGLGAALGGAAIGGAALMNQRPVADQAAEAADQEFDFSGLSDGMEAPAIGESIEPLDLDFGDTSDQSLNLAELDFGDSSSEELLFEGLDFSNSEADDLDLDLHRSEPQALGIEELNQNEAHGDHLAQDLFENDLEELNFDSLDLNSLDLNDSSTEDIGLGSLGLDMESGGTLSNTTGDDFNANNDFSFESLDHAQSPPLSSDSTNPSNLVGGDLDIGELDGLGDLDFGEASGGDELGLESLDFGEASGGDELGLESLDFGEASGGDELGLESLDFGDASGGDELGLESLDFGNASGSDHDNLAELSLDSTGDDSSDNLDFGSLDLGDRLDLDETYLELDNTHPDDSGSEDLDLGDLERNSSESFGSDFDDLDDLLQSSDADLADGHDLSDQTLESLGELDFGTQDIATDDAFDGLDQLLNDEEESPGLDLGAVAGATAFAAGGMAIAGGMLNRPRASSALDDGDFADIEALLDDEDSDMVSVASSSSDRDFDELDSLLKDAEEKLGGSPSSRQSVQNAPTRRQARPGGRGFSEQTMRVPVKHLDNLSNLVGELVVNRNSLEQDQERLRQSLDNLLYQVQQLSDVGQRMQDLYERSLLESSLLASRQARSGGISISGFASVTALPKSESSTAEGMSPTGVEYDPLEMDRFTGFHTLSQEMIELIVRVRESASDIEFIVDETDQVTRMFRQVTTQLQEGLTRSRMVPFGQTADRLPRAVRDISIKVGKQVELQIEGRDTLIDKMILEHLYDPMTHLVNNALTHGIEAPDVRQANGKSPVGKIMIRAFHQGNQTVISVSDDGAGIDVERVKSKALEKGLINSDQAKNMSRLDAYDLLFHAGFSTRDQADDFAGRGVGMDVVRTSLSEIRGAITTDSTQGKGTSFTIRLPLTLSISKSLCCISDRARIAFPMDGVEDMLDLPKERIHHTGEGQPSISWRDSVLPLHPLNELLGYNRHLSRGNIYGGHQEDDIISIVVLRSAGNYLALQVDQVLGEQEIVIKQLEGPVPKPIGVAGATVLGDGRIMPIADVLELIDLSMGRIRKDSGGSLWDSGIQEPAEPVETKTDPMVLIVDDSITVRELLSMTFNKVGYRVEQARDGQEAWEKLRSGLPCDIVFCDIEMPRMDGLELLSRIQKDPNLNNLPIAMLTSRGADRHRQMAASLGARGYFTKPYLEEALLDAADRMLNGEVLLTSG